MNFHAIRAIYTFEMARTFRTLLQSIVSPVISTSLYFVVFGAAIGSRITSVEGVGYGSFIVPGLIMLTLLTQSISNASFGIFFPKFTGTIYEVLSAPVSYIEIVLGYVGAAATKSVMIGLIILATSGLFVPIQIDHPLWMISFLILTSVTFSLFGFIIGIWANDIPRRQLLLGEHVAAVLAEGHPLQPCRLSDQRLPLEFLRARRRKGRCEPGHDDRLSSLMPDGGMVDLQNRVPAQGVASVSIWEG